MGNYLKRLIGMKGRDMFSKWTGIKKILIKGGWIKKFLGQG